MDSFWFKWYGMLLGFFLVFGGILALIVTLAMIFEPKCTAAREGVIHYPGEGGGFKYICHDGAWVEMR